MYQVYVAYFAEIFDIITSNVPFTSHEYGNGGLEWFWAFYAV